MIESFPTEAPFRLDQVMEAPWLVGGLFLIQLLFAAFSTAAARCRDMRSWLLASVSLLSVTAVFFCLATWGTSDIAKLNFSFDVDRHAVAPWYSSRSSEPLWWVLAPLILSLPYRMAAFHGLIVAGFAAIPIVLARSWALRQWTGWWSLLIVTSPFLRGFFQNAHSRQALATLLATPLFIFVMTGMRWRPFLVLGSSVLALGAHLTALPTLLIAAMPSVNTLFGASVRLRRIAGLLAFTTLVVALSFAAPIASKLNSYSNFGFYSSYPIKVEVVRCQLVMLITVVIVCVRQRLTWMAFWSQREGQALIIYLAAYACVQAMVFWRFWPQVAFRFGDPVGLFLLFSYLAWLWRRRVLWIVIPLLLLCLLTWADRLFWPQGLTCGLDDDFLCLPDRLPWFIRYSHP